MNKSCSVQLQKQSQEVDLLDECFICITSNTMLFAGRGLCKTRFSCIVLLQIVFGWRFLDYIQSLSKLILSGPYFVVINSWESALSYNKIICFKLFIKLELSIYER